jgi:hypothetical protein
MFCPSPSSVHLYDLSLTGIRDARHYPVLTLTGPRPDTATLGYGGTEAFTRSAVAVRPWFAI